MSLEYLYEEEKIQGGYDIRLTKRLVSYVYGHRKNFAWAFLLVLLVTSGELFVPYATRIGVDCLMRLPGAHVSVETCSGLPQEFSLLNLSIVLLGILILIFFANAWQGYLLQKTAQGVVKKLREELFLKLLRLQIPFFNHQPVGKLVARVTSDVGAVNELFSVGFISFLKDIILISGIFLLMMLLNFKLSLVIFALIPVMVFLALRFKTSLRIAYREIRTKIAKLSAFLQEAVRGIETIKYFNYQTESSRRYHNINQEELGASMQELFAFSLFQPAIAFVHAFAVVVVVWLGGREVYAGALSAGTLIAFLIYVNLFFAPLRDLADKFHFFQSALAACERIFMFLDQPEEKIGLSGNIMPIKGQVEFKDVWFAYKGEEWVLKGVSFKVEAGNQLGLVGPTGSGKTTIANLIFGFYSPQKGSILIDGEKVGSCELYALRKQISYVPQEMVVFSGGIEDNINLGRAEKVSTSMEHVLKLIGFNPQMKGSRNADTLSVGEKQLLCLARAMAGDPKLIVLDEASAHVDSYTESVIQRSLGQVLKGKTSLIIAHRLSTVKEAHEIVVLKRGEVVERGCHQELLRRGGLYSRLYSLQSMLA